MRESRTLEFKEDMSKTFLKTVSAFANYGGGTVVFGINDEGLASGVRDIDDLCLDIENKINDSIRPQPEFEIYINGKNNTIELVVPEGRYKPYLYRAKAYRRNNTSTIEVDSVEMNRLILEGKNINYESLPSDRQNLTFDTFGQKLKEETGIGEINEDILRTLNLYSTDEGYNVAAFILSDENSLPGIVVARFGDNISTIKNRADLKGQSILESYDNAVNIFHDNYRYEVIRGQKRTVVDTIPDEAFREALANAVIHRVWDVSSDIRIFMFDDRVEITSPGGLPFDLSEEEYIHGKISSLRNPILANIFYRLKMVEILGTGVIRIKEAYRNSYSKPSFEISENSIKITLPRFEDRIDVTDDEKKVYDTLSKSRAKPVGEIVNNIPFGRSKVKSLLKEMADRDLVEVVGNNRGTKYRIK